MTTFDANNKAHSSETGRFEELAGLRPSAPLAPSAVALLEDNRGVAASPRDDDTSRHYEIDGAHEWRVRGELHREGGPALITRDGDEAWYRHGVLHRVDGPAVTTRFGDEEWWVDGALHREDGPAIVRGDREEWRVRGVRHRVGGPAIRKIEEDGVEYQAWCEGGVLHRLGGPAVTGPYGQEAYFVGGVLHRPRGEGPADRHLIEVGGTMFWENQFWEGGVRYLAKRGRQTFPLGMVGQPLPTDEPPAWWTNPQF